MHRILELRGPFQCRIRRRRLASEPRVERSTPVQDLEAQPCIGSSAAATTQYLPNTGEPELTREGERLVMGTRKVQHLNFRFLHFEDKQLEGKYILG